MESSYCLSSDGKTKLHLVYWNKVQRPVGIVQIIHGMAEYIERYNDFSKYLNQLGYIVVGHDHLGHGQSVDPDNPIYGYFGEGETAKILIKDVHQVKQQVKEKYPELPYYMLGHSMGSFVLRNYLQMYSDKNAGVLFMGTGAGSAIIPMALTITKRLNLFQPTKVNSLLDKLAFGSFSKGFPESSSFNWLSKNQENVRNYEQDSLTGFTFTNNGFHTLFQLIQGANHRGWAEKLSKETPVLVISGEKDPVGDYGKGVKKVAKALNDGEIEVAMALFTGLRHEILFEDERQQVYEGIGNWLKKHNPVTS